MGWLKDRTIRKKLRDQVRQKTDELALLVLDPTEVREPPRASKNPAGNVETGDGRPIESRQAISETPRLHSTRDQLDELAVLQEIYQTHATFKVPRARIVLGIGAIIATALLWLSTVEVASTPVILEVEATAVTFEAADSLSWPRLDSLSELNVRNLQSTRWLDLSRHELTSLHLASNETLALESFTVEAGGRVRWHKADDCWYTLEVETPKDEVYAAPSLTLTMPAAFEIVSATPSLQKSEFVASQGPRTIGLRPRGRRLHVEWCSGGESFAFPSQGVAVRSLELFDLEPLRESTMVQSYLVGGRVILEDAGRRELKLRAGEMLRLGEVDGRLWVDKGETLHRETFAMTFVGNVSQLELGRRVIRSAMPSLPEVLAKRPDLELFWKILFSILTLTLAVATLFWS